MVCTYNSAQMNALQIGTYIGTVVKTESKPIPSSFLFHLTQYYC